MKKWSFLFFFFCGLTSFSQTVNDKSPVVEPAAIVKDLMSWLVYERDYLVWSADYYTFDESFAAISKMEFLERLSTGKFLPVKLKSADASVHYQLYELEKSIDKDIVSTIADRAIRQLRYLKMEGMPLPDFNFTDLNNRIYNSETTKDKIVVINCWFVACTPCAAEMPDLNQLVKQYQKQKDVLFVALTLDPADAIRDFLKQKEFRYAIVPDKDAYLKERLKIIGYPTQLIVNRQGKITKVIESNKINELKEALRKEINNPDK